MIHHHSVGDARIVGVVEYSGPTHDPAFLYPDIPKAERDAFMAEATAGDYDHLLQTAMAWVVVE